MPHGSSVSYSVISTTSGYQGGRTHAFAPIRVRLYTVISTDKSALARGSRLHRAPLQASDQAKCTVFLCKVVASPRHSQRAEVDVQREKLTVVRDDFWASTSNKQLNFVQHVKTLLQIDGRAAIVVPDNVLFEGGAGETIRRRLLHDYDVHSLLRLPTGIFYEPGVKANVLFFDRKPASEAPWTKELWVYDLRTNQHFTLKETPLNYSHLENFVEAYQADNRHVRRETERFKRFTYDELVTRDKANLDIFWLRDESLEDIDNLPSPHVIAAEIVEGLEAALTEFSSIAETLSTADDAIDPG